MTEETHRALELQTVGSPRGPSTEGGHGKETPKKLWASWHFVGSGQCLPLPSFLQTPDHTILTTSPRS